MRAIDAILKRAALQAEETIKWRSPFFVEPRFVYAFSSHKVVKSGGVVKWKF